MLIDDRGKLFGKISIVDVFAVLLVAGVLFGTAYKLHSPVTSTFTGGDTPIYYQVKIVDVRAFTADYYEEGLDVYDSKTGNYLGVISGVTVNPYEGRLELADGSVIKTEKTEKVEIRLDINARGVETDQAFLVEGTYEIKVGAGIYLTTKYVDVEGVVNQVYTEK